MYCQTSVVALMTSNRAAITLYRDILRQSRRFHWCNDKGEPWNVILARNARAEFEAGRHERDPLIAARLLVTARDCLVQTQYKFDMAAKKIRDNIENTRTRN